MSQLRTNCCRLLRNLGFSWTQTDRLAAKGYLFDDQDVYYEGRSLIQYLGDAETVEQFRHKVAAANGHFAVVAQIGNSVCVAVDRLRSIPLFFTMVDDHLLVSDDAGALREGLCAIERDPMAELAFSHAGYTLERDTLHPEVKQLCAGEVMSWDESTRRLSIERYFRHFHHHRSTQSEAGLVDELDDLTVRWARRLIASVGDRSIVIPLSGGYDSRLILCALKREGYREAICYTYGRAGSFETHTARQVANQLGYRHYEIYYDRNTWKQLLHSRDFAEYCRFSANDSSVPHFQDLPALRELTDKRLIPHDALIVPGFCGDVLGGSFVPIEVSTRQWKLLLHDGIDHHLFRQHFHLSGHQMAPLLEDALRKRIRASFESAFIEDITDFVSVLEDWVTRHRLAKFVVNALRVYEWLGYGWRMPLWDGPFMEWWYHVPLQLRSESMLYHRYLFTRLFDPAHVAFRKGLTKRRFETALGRYLPQPVVDAVVRAYLMYRPQTSKVNVNAFVELKQALLEDVPARSLGADQWHLNRAVAHWWLNQRQDSGTVLKGSVP